MSFNDAIDNETDVLSSENITALEETYTEIITVFSTLLELETYIPGNNTGLTNLTLQSNESSPVNDENYIKPDETLILVFTWIVYTTVFVTGTSGNLLVMFAIHQCRQVKGVPAMLLASLAVADFLVCLIIVPSEMYSYYSGVYHLGPFACGFTTFLNQLVFACSSFTLTLISIERLYVVKYPLQARAVITTRRARVVIVVIWLFAALCAVPNTHRQKHIRYEVGIYKWAVCSLSEKQPWKKVNAMFDFFVKFTIPVLIMAISYAVVITTLYKSTRQSKRLQSIKMSDSKFSIKTTNGEMAELTNKSVKNKANKTKAEKQQADRNQAILMLLIVVLLYFLTWGPFMVYQLLDRLDVIDPHFDPHMRLTYTILKMVGIGNSCMNPFLYVFMSKSFRSAIRTTLCCRKGADMSMATNNIGRSTSGGLNSRTVTSRYSISGIRTSDN